MTIYGYARVSTGDRSSTGSSISPRPGCGKIYGRRSRGPRPDRPELAKALKTLGQSDVLIACRLDRLARSTRDLLNVLAEISDRGASFKSLGDA